MRNTSQLMAMGAKQDQTGTRTQNFKISNKDKYVVYRR